MADDFQTQYKAAFEAATGETPKEAVDSKFDGIDPDILKTAVSSLQAYAASPEGKVALANAPSLTPETLANMFQSALNSSWFEDLLELVDKATLKAVSLGVMGQVEVAVGIAGTVGYAMDVKNAGATSAVYGGGGLVEGADVGGEVSLCVGLWRMKTEDIGGIMGGAQVDATDGLGVDMVVFGDKDSISDLDKGSDSFIKDILGVAKVIFIGVDAGIEDGVDADEYYFFAGHIDKTPAFQSGPYDNIVMLKHLVCNNSYAVAGTHDEVYMTYTVDDDKTTYRYPIWNTFSLNTKDDDTWHCDNMIKFNDKFTITLEVNQGEIPSGPEISVTWQASDFTSENNYQSQKDFNNNASWHENTVCYTLNVELISTT